MQVEKRLERMFGGSRELDDVDPASLLPPVVRERDPASLLPPVVREREIPPACCPP